MPEIKQSVKEILKKLNVNLNEYSGKGIKAYSPIDGALLAELKIDSTKEIDAKIKQSEAAFRIWRDIPAPKRGELIRIFGEELRKSKEPLGQLVSIECGKVLQEGLGEVQEMIDICDFAVGLSRTIGGATLPSERTNHTMSENWMPLGVVGVISAFNFPVAVWAWNFALAVICGDSVVWKPSEKTLVAALGANEVFLKAAKIFEKSTGIKVPSGLSNLIIGGRKEGERLVNSKAITLISATGSTRMGKDVGLKAADRFAKSLLELGGNNAIIITENADMNIALPSILFGAVGTCGQRCTTTRRLLVHKKIYNEVYTKLKNAYSSLKVKIGNPLDQKYIIGPLIDEQAYENMQEALKNISKSADEVIGGKRVIINKNKKSFYVEPALVKIKKQVEQIKHEVFAPILYVIPFGTLEEALELNNDVPQGLSSAIFTTDLREAEYFKKYSDCGISNVNIGTSGAEIGGAFGGEKETGGGRESGSDSWKAYMRRQTSTTYYGNTAPALAQGIKFNI